MAIISKGYDGTILEGEWGQIVAFGGGTDYNVGGPEDWKVLVGSGDRAVRVRPGMALGHGVRDINDSDVVLSLPSVASGSRWDMIVARRNWSSNATTVARIEGVGIASIPTRNITPGTLDDQPLALVQVIQGQSQVGQIIDLRVWSGPGGLFATDRLVMGFLTRVGTIVTIDRQQYMRDIILPAGTPAWTRLSGGVPVGTVVPYSGATAPQDWLLSQGQPVLINDYPDLYASIAPQFKTGNDPGYFVLPNLGQRVPVGFRSGDGDFGALGKLGGAKTHTLTPEQMPSHTHSQSPHSHYIGGPIGGQLSGMNGGPGSGGSGAGYFPWYGGGWGGSAAQVSAEQPAIQASGGGQSHNILQPYIVLNYIIKVR